MYDYGNARIAARRSRLLDATALEHLAQGASTAAAVALLERRPEWAEPIRSARQVAREPAALLDLAVEQHRAGELAALPRWYDGRARPLVEALVMDLDRERTVAIIRRRRAGQDATTINATIVRGALLSGSQLAELARQPILASLLATLGRMRVLDARDATRLAAGAAQLSARELEEGLDAAWRRARMRRAAGSGGDTRHVRHLLAEEAAAAETVADELAGGGPGAGALVERSLRLARLDSRAASAHRDPGGIGPVAAYVAAVEAHAIRLRTVLARLEAGWSPEVARAYLAGAEA